MPSQRETALVKERDALRNWMQSALSKTWPEYSALTRRQCVTANTAEDRLVIPDTRTINSKETHTPTVISCTIKLKLIMKSVSWQQTNTIFKKKGLLKANYSVFTPQRTDHCQPDNTDVISHLLKCDSNNIAHCVTLTMFLVSRTALQVSCKTRNVTV